MAGDVDADGRGAERLGTPSRNIPTLQTNLLVVSFGSGYVSFLLLLLLLLLLLSRRRALSLTLVWCCKAEDLILRSAKDVTLLCVVFAPSHGAHKQQVKPSIRMLKGNINKLAPVHAPTRAGLVIKGFQSSFICIPTI